MNHSNYMHNKISCESLWAASGWIQWKMKSLVCSKNLVFHAQLYCFLGSVLYNPEITS